MDPVSGDRQLVLDNVNKSFPGVRALSDVDLEVAVGEVHALVGENGAGKSTLMAVASGALTPDTGSVTIQGTQLSQTDPMQAQALGLAIVRQVPALLPQLTVLENMELTRGTRWIGSFRSARAWAASWLDPWGLPIDPRSRVEDLTVEQRQIVEVARALSTQPKVLILDEPTEHLNVEESEKLFEQVRNLVDQGGSVVYISHRIPEVKAIADRITVLRDGKVRGTFASDDVDEHQIISLVIGRELDAVFPEKAPTSLGGGGIEVSSFRGPDFGSVDFHARSGEIVGIAGVQGNGQDEFIRAMCGLGDASGTLRVNDRSVRTGSTTATSKAGVLFVPADRHSEGVFMPLAVGDNIALGGLDEVSSSGVVQRGKVKTVAQGAVDRFDIKTPNLTTPVSSLSGGNQQKILMARSATSEVSVLVAEEPTQGVDAGARVEIYNIMRQVANDGAAVVVNSSDNLELAGLCDRVVIFSRGQIVQELVGADITEQAITSAALRSTSIRERVTETTRGLKVPRWLKGDYAASIVLVALTILLGVFVATQNEFYLTARNLTGLLALLAPLAIAAAAQQTAMLGGGIDLSVGPLSGFMLVVASFYVIAGVAPMWWAVGFLLIALVGLLVGLTNGALIELLKVNAVIVTLALFMLLRGLSLTLRDRPQGSIAEQVTSVISAKIGPIPWTIIIIVAMIIVLELLLRRSRWGMSLRAIGSNSDAAGRIGVRVGRVRFWSYVITSLLIVPVGIMLMAQVGIGDPSSGITYTLSSITAVVLGGARVLGGRGSYIGALFGALLIMQVTNVTAFLQLGQSWQYWLMGILLLGSTLLFAIARKPGA